MRKRRETNPCGGDGNDFCPWCYANVRGRENNRNHRHYRQIRRQQYPYGDPHVKRPNQNTIGENPSQEFGDERFAKKFPRVTEYLTTTQWEDGSEREPSAISLFIEQGAFKAALNDKALKRSAYVTGKTLEDALGVLERGLEKDSLDWRVWGKATKRK